MRTSDESDEIGRTTTSKTSNTEHGTTKSSNTSRDHQWKAQKGPPPKATATNQNERKKAEKEEGTIKN